MNPRRLELMFSALRRDDWRKSQPFSAPLQAAHATLWSEQATESEKVAAIKRWIASHQVCLFAQYAARHDLLDYIVVFEEELVAAPKATFEKAQRGRLAAQKRMYERASMGWLAIVVSRRFAEAAPDSTSRELALALLQGLTGSSSVGSGDEIALSRVYLRDDLTPSSALCWESPVNFFSAQADGRWWRDRTFPGGLAFSVNSVGHSATAALIPPNTEYNWAVKTLERTASCEVSRSDASYSAPYRLDSCLPAEFFEGPEPTTRAMYRLTTEFSQGTRRSGKNSWDAPEERADGRPFRVALSELPFEA